MKDARIVELATTLLTHSIGIKAGDKVLLRGHYVTKPLLLELVEQTYQLGALPYIDIMDQELSRQLALGYTREQLETLAQWELKKYQDIDAVVIVIGEDNDAEMSDVPKERHLLRGEVMKPVSDFYVNQRRWVLLNYPTPSLAQKAGMSTVKFTDHLFKVCTIDYKKMAVALKPLKELMEKTDRVRITGPNTDLSFSIKGIPAIPCAGESNIPDGEIFTAPTFHSASGRISFNTPCPYRGITFNQVSLVLEEGKIIEATSDQTEKLNEILDTDKGARYIGEFAIGIHPYILEPMGDILFDEKIAGSLHFTPGQAYDEADNGNRSAIHWDMVLIQRPEYGGGEIYFDDVLIRKDGLFVLPELEGLNPERLK